MNLRLVKREPEPPRELDDVTLARARRSDPAACRALVERYQRPVFAMLSRMLGPAGRAGLVEDLAQETFLRVFRALPGFRPKGAKLSTWILTITTRLAIDELRRRRPELQAVADIEVASSERADKAVTTRELSSAIETALDELNPDMRAAFVLRAFSELSHEEIARVLDVEVGTAKSRIARARAHLRSALADEHRQQENP